MKKFLVFSFCSAVLCGSMFLTSGEAKAHDENEPQKIIAAEYNYDTGLYSFEYVDGYDPADEGEFSVMSHDPRAGGGYWTHYMNGLKDHVSSYDHKTWLHRGKASNSRNTVNGPWKNKKSGYSTARAYQSLTGNKANWQISVDSSLPEN
ncbi:hypothetical protein ACI2JA_10820 [Alkalihalobacillus sp. NPDC078783]